MKRHIKDFIDYLNVSGASPRTIGGHRERLIYFERFLERNGIRELAEITPQVTTAYQSSLYNYITRYHRPLALRSQIQILLSLRRFFSFLAETDVIAVDPTTAVHLPIGRPTMPRDILSQAEMKLLLKQPDVRTLLGFRDRTMLELFYCCGLRIAEAMALTVNDPDLDNGYLKVWGKGGKIRTVPLGKKAAGYLREYLSKIRPILNKRKDRESLFLTRSGKPWEKSGLLKKLHAYTGQTGISKHITPHSFRDFLATEMLKKGADIRYIQEILGHSTLVATQRYLQIVKTELKRSYRISHPREKIDLPENAINYHGPKTISADTKV
jgi:integrase/recombinase XerD